MSVRVTGAPEFIAVDDDWRAISGASVKDWANKRERAFKLRRASKPRPGDVFLQCGEFYGLEGAINFGECADVTWAAAPVFDTDLAYRPVRWRR